MSANLNARELKLINDTSFLLSKVTITEKLSDLLSVTKDQLHKTILKSKFQFPVKTEPGAGKIFRGENYKHLPYLLLDYPRNFSKESVFALRTMFWWGKEFSSTLHLQGKALEQFRNKLTDNAGKLGNKNIFICVNKSPWQYHFEKDNYVPADSLTKKELTELIRTKDFIKLSRKTGLNDWEELPHFACKSIDIYIKLLS